MRRPVCALTPRRQGAPLAVLFGLWALATAASRVAMGRHYVGDVLTGWLLGAAEFRAVRAWTPAVCTAA